MMNTNAQTVGGTRRESTSEGPHRVLRKSGRPSSGFQCTDGRHQTQRKALEEERVVFDRAGFPNADLYQLLAYRTVLGLSVGHLIYTKGNAESREYTVRRAGIRLIAHTLDLSLPPHQLLASIGDIAKTVETNRATQAETPAWPELAQPHDGLDQRVVARGMIAHDRS